MKIIAINGSPRKNGNTATLLKNALEGAAKQGAETEMISLYDLNFKGCISCFACKLKGGKSYGKCAYRDEASQVFEKIFEADALLLGSPLYFESVTGEMSSFLERLMFPIFTYTKEYKSLLDKKIPVGFIYTMNVTEEYMKEANYLHALKFKEIDLERLFGSFESLVVNDTLQFNDYSKYVMEVFDGETKKKVRENHFKIDCKNAFDLGARLIQKSIN